MNADGWWASRELRFAQAQPTIHNVLAAPRVRKSTRFSKPEARTQSARQNWTGYALLVEYRVLSRRKRKLRIGRIQMAILMGPVLSFRGYDPATQQWNLTALVVADAAPGDLSVTGQPGTSQA